MAQYIWYFGKKLSRTISAAKFLQMTGDAHASVTWDAANNYSVTNDFTARQLAYLLGVGGFIGTDKAGGRDIVPYATPDATDQEVADAIAAALAQKALADKGTYSARTSPYRGAICFVYDDGFLTHHTAGVAHQALNQKATFAITTSLLGSSASYMSSAQMLALSQMGHEIAAHGVTHVDMTAQSAANRLIEYENSKTAIEAIIGAGTVKSWAYPLGARSTTTDRELYLRYDRILCTTSPAPRRHLMDDRAGKYMLGRIQWDGTAAQHANVLAAIRQAANSPIIPIIYTHDIGAAGSASSVQHAEALALANSLGVPCLTLAEAFPAAPLLLDPGFDDTTLGSWEKVESGGTMVAESVAEASGRQNYKMPRVLHLQCLSDTGYVYAQQIVPVVGGQAYSFSGQYKTSATRTGAGSVQVRVTEFDIYGNQLAQNTSTLTQTSYQPFAITNTLNAQTSYCRIDAAIINLTTEAWFGHWHFGPTRHGIHGN